MSSGQSATVKLTYPCNLTIMGVNYGGSVCTLSAQSTYTVQ
jgi:hypothetical protein